MTILKYTLAMLLLGLLPFFAQAQDYYIQKDDAGLNTALYQDSLEQHAKDLVFAIPEGPLRDAFRVYGFGFYQHSEVTDGYPAAFEKMRTQIASETPYYLIFGKQTDETGVYTRFWVDVKLPEGGAFNCWDDISGNLRSDIGDKIDFTTKNTYSLLNRSSTKYQLAEMAAMDSLRNIILKFIGCCNNSNTSSAYCNGCVKTLDEFVEDHLEKNIFLTPVFIVNDADSIYLTSNGTGIIPSLQQLNVAVKFSANDAVVAMDDLIMPALQWQKQNIESRLGVALGNPEVYYFKYPRDCENFTTIWNDYQNSSADIKFFVSIINIDNKVGLVGCHISGAFHLQNTIASKNGEDLVSIQTDELEGLHIAQTEEEGSASGGQACWDVCIASIVKVVMLTPSYQLTMYALPTNIRERVEAYNEFADQSFKSFDTYYSKEYDLVSRDLASSSWVCCESGKVWVGKSFATFNICADVIHNILDACGLIPIAGEICDGANGLIYLAEGDYLNAVTSLASVVPVAGWAITGAKYLGNKGTYIVSKVWKTGVGSCLTAGNKGSESSVGQLSCRLLTSTISGGKIVWNSSRDRLKNLMSEMDLVEPPHLFTAMVRSPNGSTIPISRRFTDTDQAHHIIPWAVASSDEVGDFFQRAIGANWHVNNPILNGYPVPSIFHTGSGGNQAPHHVHYNRWVQKAITNLAAEATRKSWDAITSKNKLQELVDVLKNNIESAIQQETQLDDFFKNLDPY
ncbi:MAG: hypothetical protein RIR11_3060 [Bacteroidota bacterium]|jgi:hypothetical protein